MTRDAAIQKGEDDLYAKALKIVKESDRTSISLVQRKLRISWNTAAELVDRMEAAGEVELRTSASVLCPTAGHASGSGEAIADAMLKRTGEQVREQAARRDGRLKALQAIHDLLHTQDNRITAAPLFAVQQKRRVYGVDSDYADNTVWIDDEGREVGAEEAAELEANYQRTGAVLPGTYRRVGYHEYWEFVTGCFTEQGCKDYLARNGHNLGETRIYAYGTYRNTEWAMIRDFLMSDVCAAVAAKSDAVIASRAAVRACGNWISVSERVPEIHEFRPGSGSGISDRVLVLLDDEDDAGATMAVWSYRRGGRGDTTSTYWDYDTPKVRYWMPLPAVPASYAGTKHE